MFKIKFKIKINTKGSRKPVFGSCPLSQPEPREWENFSKELCNSGPHDVPIREINETTEEQKANQCTCCRGGSWKKGDIPDASKGSHLIKEALPSKWH